MYKNWNFENWLAASQINMSGFINFFFFVQQERQLPRLIRGQVHRCVGNYDQGREVLVCVSIRPALPSEQRNSDEAVKVCDAEMRLLVKSFSEVWAWKGIWEQANVQHFIKSV